MQFRITPRGDRDRLGNLARPHLVVERAEAVEAAPAPLLGGEVEDGEEDVDHLVGDEEAAEHGGRHRADDLGADAVGPEHRGDGDDGRPLGQELGAEAVDRPVQDRLAQLGHRADFSRPPRSAMASRR